MSFCKSSAHLGIGSGGLGSGVLYAWVSESLDKGGWFSRGCKSMFWRASISPPPYPEGGEQEITDPA